MYLCYFSFVLL